jgi:uncharacterized membrane protein
MSYSTSSHVLETSGARTASLVGWLNLIYALHALSIVTGILGAATVVGAFLIGWPSIIAVVITYLKRSEALGTWLASHFRWLLRTFWYGVLWATLCMASLILTFGIALVVVWIPLAILTIWFIYRIARGWSALWSRRPMYR